MAETTGRFYELKAYSAKHFPDSVTGRIYGRLYGILKSAIHTARHMNKTLFLEILVTACKPQWFYWNMHSAQASGIPVTELITISAKRLQSRSFLRQIVISVLLHYFVTYSNNTA